MGKIKKVINNLPLRRAFVLCVLLTILIAVIASAFTIWGCMSFRSWILPEADNVYLSVNTEYADGSTVNYELLLQIGQELPMFSTSTENSENQQAKVSYTLEKADNSYRILTPKRQIAYVGAGVGIILLPMVYCVVGILLCAFWFYRCKMQKPLTVLLDATEHIAGRNLDFSISYTSDDELGRLCASFEDMRAALHRTNRELWEMIEEKNNLQASIAHDLRNPIAIIKGYTEYLQLNLKKGEMHKEQILMIADNLAFSAGRLERYTDSLRHINKLESLEIHPSDCRLLQFLTAILKDMRILAEQSGISLDVKYHIPDEEIMLDTENYCRVLENIIQNALRFAKTEVCLSWQYINNMLITTVTDDGPGFKLEILNRRKHTTLSIDNSDKHIGMGLVISEILCRKHGGSLSLQNGQDTGAVVNFSFCTNCEKK